MDSSSRSSTGVRVVAAVSSAAMATFLLAWAFSTVDVEATLGTHLRNAVTAVGALGLAATAALAYQRQRLGEAQYSALVNQNADVTNRDRRDHDHEIDRDLRERFTIAASQLGNDSLPVRLAGVYAMSALADSWLEPVSNELLKPRDRAQAQVCIDVLCAYLRAGDSSSGGFSSNREVRSSIVRVLGQKFRSPDSGEDDVDGGVWSWADLDLRGALIDCPIDFSGAVFLGSFVADHAVFEQGARFSGARFSGSRASFEGVKFRGDVCGFSKARFDIGCTFSDADIRVGDVSFEEAIFFGDAMFLSASLVADRIRFDSAHFQTWMTDFSASVFSGDSVKFNAVIFGESHTLFQGVEFQSRQTLFIGTRFFGESPRFDIGILDPRVTVHDVVWSHSSKPVRDHVAFDPRLPDGQDPDGFLTYAGVGNDRRRD